MEKLSHAYIVSSASLQSGMRAARELAARMLCAAESGRPCGVCRHCRKVMSGVHPDVSVISRPTDDKGTAKGNILIEQIRAMRADASVLPNEARGKVYIISEADTMNEKAQNAALKLFEEPPGNVSFLLVTVNPEKLLTTVRSRCVTLRCQAGEENADAELETLAEEYLRLLNEGDPAALCEWCTENEKLEQRRLPELLHCIKLRLTEALRYSSEKKPLMDAIALMDRCLAYQAVNTGAKHIFGLLAVRSLPAKETRK